MQNTQHAFKIQGDSFHISHIMDSLKEIGANIFVPINPNINWNNQSNWPTTKQHFRHAFKHVHLSASSSLIGLEQEFFHQNLIGAGAVILTFDLWASKVSQTLDDDSGFRSFTVTTIQGKFNKCISLRLDSTMGPSVSL
jgi:hypothetical protein